MVHMAVHEATPVPPVDAAKRRMGRPGSIYIALDEAVDRGPERRDLLVPVGRQATEQLRRGRRSLWPWQVKHHQHVDGPVLQGPPQRRQRELTETRSQRVG